LASAFTASMTGSTFQRSPSFCWARYSPSRGRMRVSIKAFTRSRK